MFIPDGYFEAVSDGKRRRADDVEERRRCLLAVLSGRNDACGDAGMKIRWRSTAVNKGEKKARQRQSDQVPKERDRILAESSQKPRRPRTRCLMHYVIIEADPPRDWRRPLTPLGDPPLERSGGWAKERAPEARQEWVTGCTMTPTRAVRRYLESARESDDQVSLGPGNAELWAWGHGQAPGRLRSSETWDSSFWDDDIDWSCRPLMFLTCHGCPARGQLQGPRPSPVNRVSIRYKAGGQM